MEGDARRKIIIDTLTESKNPISGSALAKMLSVSRQIIVGDIALLRASGVEIISTNNGYVLNNTDTEHKIIIKVKHKEEDAFDEMCTIVDEGAKILDVFIEHDVYGRIVVPLNIESRADAKNITEKMMISTDMPLQILTGGVHYHTIEAQNDLILIRIERALKQKGYSVR